MPVMQACGTPEEEAAFGNGPGMALDMAPEATAIIGLNDGVALSMIEQAKKRGLSVPRDLSVVGFDDVAGAARSEPPLTTVHHSAFENGRLAAQMLLDGGPPRHVVLPVKLIVRASTAPRESAISTPPRRLDLGDVDLLHRPSSHRTRAWLRRRRPPSPRSGRAA